MEHSIKKLLQVYDQASPFLARKSNKIEKGEIRDLLSNLYAPGPSYHFVFDFSRFDFDFITPSIREMIDEDPETFSPERFFEHIHPEDREYYETNEKTVFRFLYSHIDRKDIPYYKISFQFRVRRKTGYRLFLHQSIAIDLDEKGNLMKTFVSQSDISHITTVNNKRISFLGLEGHPSYYNMANTQELETYQPAPVEYSPREIQIIRLLSEGLSNEEVGSALDITPETVRTHRKNILYKSDGNNMVEVVASAIRKGLI